MTTRDDRAPRVTAGGGGSTAPGVDLDGGDLEVVGRIRVASNATFLARIGETAVVYKPVAGERPLWDFPDGTLAHREAAAYLVSEALGWDVVPRTWLRDGPLGPGMVQLWREPDPEQSPVDVVPAGAVPAGWRAVVEGSDERGRPVVLTHEDSAVLRRMAVFDVVVNNADRKGGHVLPMPGGHRHGVDHGVTFHVEPRLRTVLWGWVGESLHLDELAGVERVRSGLRGDATGPRDAGDAAGAGDTADLGDRLAELLSGAELGALAARCDRLLAEGRFPGPEGDMPAVPWPLF